MQVRRFTIALLFLLGATMTLLYTAAEARALQQPPAAEQPQDELSMTRGELLSVDAEARVISVRADDGEVWEFQYTDDTQVTGGQEDTAGLATMTGAIVTVHYAAEGEINVARLVEISSEG